MDAKEKRDSQRSILQRSSEIAFDFFCNLCDHEGFHKQAVGFCTDCEDYLCQECFSYHLRPRSMRHHVLLNQLKMPKDIPLKQTTDKCIETCDTHVKETLTYYCSKHDTFGCGVCKALHHDECECVVYIPDIAGEVITSKEYKSTNLKVKKLAKETRKAIKTTQRKTKNSNKNYSYTSEFFKQLRKDFNDAVDKLETILMNDAGRIKDENQTRMQSVESQYQQILNDVEVLDSKLTSLEYTGQYCQLFFTLKRARSEIARFETTLLQLQNQNGIQEYTFKMSDEIQSLLQKPQSMASLEIINDPKTSSEQKAPSNSSVEQMGTRINQSHRPVKRKSAKGTGAGRNPKGHKSITHVADVKVKMNDDVNATYISGSVVLSDDNLVVVDHENDNVKLINMQRNEIVSHLEHGSSLWDITAVNNTQVAVTCPKDNTVLFINVNDTLILDHEVKVKGSCWGIACVNDTFVLTFDEPIKVEIINRKGKLLQTVVPERLGRQLFSNPWHLTISPNQQSIYISDWCRNTLTCLDFEGEIKATYEDETMSDSLGLAVDRDGAVYQCGRLSYNVQQLTRDLDKVQELLKESDGIEGPISVSYYGRHDQLYIGIEGSDFVKIFQLQ